MTAAEMEKYLHAHIPVSSAMGVRVVDAGPSPVVLEAPLGPNLNHRDTAFGGSVSTLAILAGWAHVHFRLRRDGRTVQTVIQRSSVEFLAPAASALRAMCRPADEAAWTRLTRALDRRGRGRVAVRVDVSADGQLVAEFEGSYVALAAAA